VLGYYIGSQIVGFVTLNKVDNNKLRIGLIAVHPEYQGKRIGSFLLVSVFKYAIENSYHQLFVATQIDNQSASSFYEKAGFILHSKTHTYHIWQSLSPLTSLT
jgi:ribosomal protein S18 acetylase RimI-like enzyme